MTKSQHLPPDLKKPIRIDLILAETSKLRRAGKDPDAHKIFEAEVRRRIALFAQFLGRAWPKNESEWESLVALICLKYELPGCKVSNKGAGRNPKWPFWKYIELEIDVSLLRQRNKKRGDYAACRYIASHPEEYDNRYPKNLATLHRHFLRAKQEIGKSDDHDDLIMLLNPKLDRDFLESRVRIYQKLVTLKSNEEKMRKKVHD